MSEYMEAWNRVNEYTKWRWANRHRPNTDLENDILRAYESVVGRWLLQQIVRRLLVRIAAVIARFFGGWF